MIADGVGCAGVRGGESMRGGEGGAEDSYIYYRKRVTNYTKEPGDVHGWEEPF